MTKREKWAQEKATENLLFLVVEYLSGRFWTDRTFLNQLVRDYGLSKDDAKYYRRLLSKHKEK